MIWPENFINKIICGDNLLVMKKMPDECIDMVITSPPYWGLRDYGFEQIFGGDKNCEHEWEKKIKKWHSDRGKGPRKEVFDDTVQVKGSRNDTCLKCQAWKGQLGLEPMPEMYIKHLTEIFNEVKRILKKEGTFWLNMGDTYNAGRSGGWAGGKKGIWHPENAPNQSGVNVSGLQPKCLCMIPERLAWSLIQNGWILRNKIPWIKPNCMPFSGKDRFTNKWEYVYYFVKSQRNYFDLDSVREPHSFNRWSLSNPIKSEVAKQAAPGQTKHSWQRKGHAGYYDAEGNLIVHPLGKNPGDVWIIPTVACPFPGVHFSTFPEKLCKKAIIPGSPEDGIVLDPFCGVGTALYVAKQLKRRFIGIDIKKEYCEKSEIRLAQGVL